MKIVAIVLLACWLQALETSRIFAGSLVSDPAAKAQGLLAKDLACRGYLQGLDGSRPLNLSADYRNFMQRIARLFLTEKIPRVPIDRINHLRSHLTTLPLFETHLQLSRGSSVEVLNEILNLVRQLKNSARMESIRMLTNELPTRRKAFYFQCLLNGTSALTAATTFSVFLPTSALSPSINVLSSLLIFFTTVRLYDHIMLGKPLKIGRDRQIEKRIDDLDLISAALEDLKQLFDRGIAMSDLIERPRSRWEVFASDEGHFWSKTFTLEGSPEVFTQLKGIQERGQLMSAHQNPLLAQADQLSYLDEACGTEKLVPLRFRLTLWQESNSSPYKLGLFVSRCGS